MGANNSAQSRSRRKPKDWYDIAYVLLHNDYGDVRDAAARVRQVFEPKIESLASSLTDLKSNFDGPNAQGTQAYIDQTTQDYPELNSQEAAADCQLAVETFCDALLSA